jgi:four helix bundle protein
LIVDGLGIGGVLAAITRVEDIEVWQEARKLAVEVYTLTSVGAWAKDFGLRDQARRAGVSVPSNIAEGFARDTNIEFRRFLSIARGSATELKTQMYIALDLGYLNQQSFDAICLRIDRICRMITSFMQYLKTAQKPTTNNHQPSTNKG